MSRRSWTILIPTIPKRNAQFVDLMRALMPQVDAANAACGSDVRVTAWRNEGVPKLGTVRDRLVKYAHLVHDADYISFVDDDDMVPDYYVEEIFRAINSCAEPPDHVGFPIEMTRDGQPFEGGRVEHSLKWSRWGMTNGRMLFRDFTHIDPVRTEIALQGAFSLAEQYGAEDRAWVKQVRPHMKTEVYIDKPMYFYRWVPAESAWQHPGAAIGNPAVRPSITNPHFSWHPESL